MQANPAEAINGDTTEEPIRPLAEARAHWSLFVPSVLVALLYGVVWLALDLTGLTGGALSKLIFLTLIFAPPVLLAYAFLRYYSTGVALTENCILVAQGWPHHLGQEIALSDVDAIEARVSTIGRLFGAGGVVIEVTDGHAIEVVDLARPQAFVDAVSRKLMGG